MSVYIKYVYDIYSSISAALCCSLAHILTYTNGIVLSATTSSARAQAHATDTPKSIGACDYDSTHAHTHAYTRASLPIHWHCTRSNNNLNEKRFFSLSVNACDSVDLPSSKWFLPWFGWVCTIAVWHEVDCECKCFISVVSFHSVLDVVCKPGMPCVWHWMGTFRYTIARHIRISLAVRWACRISWLCSCKCVSALCTIYVCVRVHRAAERRHTRIRVCARSRNPCNMCVRCVCVWVHSYGSHLLNEQHVVLWIDGYHSRLRSLDYSWLRLFVCVCVIIHNTSWYICYKFSSIYITSSATRPPSTDRRAKFV